MTKKLTKEQLESKRDFHKKRVKFYSEKLKVVEKKICELVLNGMIKL